jgi:hypothetical protein
MFELYCCNVQIPPRQHDELFNSVFEALSQMAPAKPYLRTDVKTSAGCVIGKLVWHPSQRIC